MFFFSRIPAVFGDQLGGIPATRSLLITSSFRCAQSSISLEEHGVGIPSIVLQNTQTPPSEESRKQISYDDMVKLIYKTN
jgi:hypothetical protein